MVDAARDLDKHHAALKVNSTDEDADVKGKNLEKASLSDVETPLNKAARDRQVPSWRVASAVLLT